MSKYTVFNERPEILTGCNNDGSKLKIPKYFVDNKIFEGYTSNSKIKKILDGCYMKISEDDGAHAPNCIFARTLADLERLMRRGDSNE